MEERGFEDLLEQVLVEFQYEHPSQQEGSSYPEYQIERVSRFEEAGLLTMDRGLLVRMRDGAEFQITIVRRR